MTRITKTMMARVQAGLAVLAAFGASIAFADVASVGDRLDVPRSPVDTNGIEWVDGLSLPMESKGFPQTSKPYGRLPADLLPRCTHAVRELSEHSMGHYFLFATDAGRMIVEWELEEKSGTDPYFSPQGLYGIDVYETVDGKWRFVGNGRLSYLSNPTNSFCAWMSGGGLRPVMIYLPMRGVVRRVRIGFPKGAKLARCRHPGGLERPVVHYGTSIVHGGCVSRPGLCFASVAGRKADVPYVNLGFSGCAHLEPVMADAMGRIDASLYLVDTVWNCSPDMIRERLEPFLRRLHTARPDIPILVCEGIEPRGTRLGPNDALKEVYDRLAAEGSTLSARLRYLPAKGLIPTDGEATLDYCHPNDYGAVMMGRAFAQAIRANLR